MDVLLEVTVLFTLVLALSFLIERLLEILKAIYDLLDSRFHFYRFWTRMTYRVRDRLERRLRIFEYVEPKEAAIVLNRFQEMILNERQEYTDTVPILSGDLVRAFSIKVVSKVIAILLGIGLAFWIRIDLLSIWQESAGDSFKWVSNIISPGFRIALSGAVMGLGSGPVHKILTTLEKKKQQQKEKGE